jgi:UDP-N-acetyl-D-galactosamine dehydrogenase
MALAATWSAADRQRIQRRRRGLDTGIMSIHSISWAQVLPLSDFFSLQCGRPGPRRLHAAVRSPKTGVRTRTSDSVSTIRGVSCPGWRATCSLLVSRALLVGRGEAPTWRGIARGAGRLEAFLTIENEKKMKQARPGRHQSKQPLFPESRLSAAINRPTVVKLRKCRIGVIGLGYVGLPLAVEFGKHFDTMGFDIKAARIADLRAGRDSTLEASKEELASATRLSFSTELADLKRCRVYIVTVPTPIDEYKRPDLVPLIGASATVGKVLKKGDVVVYESTVYPGCTEERCVPVLERESGLKFNRDFFVGYSPERINPGDKEHRLTTIRKVTAGSTPETAEFVDALYATIVKAGTHKVSGIKVAEAAKVIENTQRDVNIALINELAVIFNRLGIDTEEVLNAAGSKWNFLPFRPGLVGGHCIGVDPYYLTHKAQEIGYHPEMILAGRRLNDNMPIYVAQQISKLMARKRIHVNGSRALVLGITFKENCPDIRNSKVVDVVRELQNHGAQVDVYDPWADVSECRHEYGLRPIRGLNCTRYDAAVLAVAHREFREMGVEGVRRFCKKNHVLYDIKHVFRACEVDGRL